MAAKVIEPGFGGRYTSESMTLTTVAANGADTIDCSRCASLALQISARNLVGATGTLQLQQSFDGTNFANLGGTLSIATLGAVLLFDPTDGPFGLIRIQAISTGTNGSTVTATLIGFPLQTQF